jgi:hypothetical protein
MKMNWGAWFSGLIAALATGILTALVAIAVLPALPTGWQLFLVAGVPTALQFFGYLKQTPPPFGKEDKPNA